MAELKPEEVSLDNLLLDPNNYRFLDIPEFVWAEESRFHENSVQDTAYRRLRDSSLSSLKNSILSNGFLPIERLVVRPYPHKEDTYVVLEGNRRVAALRWIREDDQAGVDVPANVKEVLDKVPVLVMAERDPEVEAALLGIRHVSGIRDWGPYQRARIVAMLRDEQGLDGANVAARLGMGPHEANRRYRAYKALMQMKADEVFGDYQSPGLYPLFHEAVSHVAIRDEWLEWDDTEYRFTNASELEKFYELITPTDTDNGPEAPKITSSDQVRTLKDILPNAEARTVLFDAPRPLLDAEVVAKRDEISRAWASQVADATTALEAIETREVKAFSEDDVKALARLRQVVDEILDDHRRLTQ